MATLKALKSAYAELIDVLGLVDGKKKPLIIPKDADEDFLKEKIKECLDTKGLIRDDDEFTKPTQAVLDELKEGDGEPEEEIKPVRGKTSTDKKPAASAPVGKKPASSTADKFKHENSFAAFTDEVLLEGGTFDEILPVLAKEIKKRGLKMAATPGLVKTHVAFRLRRDPKWLGKLKLTENGIE